MKTGVAALLLLAALLLAGTAEARKAKEYTLKLHRAANVTKTKTQATLRYYPMKNRLPWALTIKNADGFLGAHFHYDPTGKYNGPIAVYLKPKNATFVASAIGESFKKRTFSGAVHEGGFQSGWNGTFDGFMMAIRKKAVYVNLHDAKHPNGLIQAYLRLK